MLIKRELWISDVIKHTSLNPKGGFLRLVTVGYISKALFAELFEHGVQLITKLRSNMKNQVMELSDKLMLRKLHDLIFHIGSELGD